MNKQQMLIPTVFYELKQRGKTENKVAVPHTLRNIYLWIHIQIIKKIFKKLKVKAGKARGLI